jgi:hypothetical protein
VRLSVIWKIKTRRGLQRSVQLGLPTVVVFGVGAPPELLVFETLGEQTAAIANIDSVSLCDALGVGNPWVKMDEKRYYDFCYLCSGLPERQDSKMHNVTGEGIKEQKTE